MNAHAQPMLHFKSATPPWINTTALLTETRCGDHQIMADQEVPRTFLAYKIVNQVNKKFYFGVTSGPRTPEKLLAKRFAEHIKVAVSGKFDGHLQQAIRKYGPENFTIEMVVECVDQREMVAIERGLIAQSGAMNPAIGYNMSGGGELSSGVVRRKETKDKLSKISTDLWADPDYRTKALASMAERVMPESHFEHLRRLAASQKGVPLSAETIARMSAAQMGHAPTANADTGAKQAVTMRAAWRDPATNAKLLASIEKKIGQKRTAETKELMSISNAAAWQDPAIRAERMRKTAETRARNGTKPGPKNRLTEVK